MSKTSSPDIANPLQNDKLSVNEKILKECHNLYIEPEKGLIDIASQFGLKLLAPRKKIIILLIGNHSAGKSSFINWYVEEHVQKTGVAIETQGICLVTSGKRRESLMGNATLHLYPHFKPLQQISGVMDFLSTEISTSNKKKFSLVTFVDTPGLVDGDMQYLFDVNEAVLWLGSMADLIFVFFDPIGQALCKRTLNLVEKLNSTNAEKMRFYLSKADDAGNESDRQRVMMQIVQELCKRPGLNRTGFDMPTIFIPELNKPSKCTNQIEETCRDIEKTINRTIQNTLNTLEKDCNDIKTLIRQGLSKDEADKNYNYKTILRTAMMGGAAAIIPLVLCLHLVITGLGTDFMHSVFGEEFTYILHKYLSPVRILWSIVPASQQWNIFLVVLALSAVLFLLTQSSLGLRTTLTRKQKHSYIEMLDHVCNVVVTKKTQLYFEYLEQSVGDHDL
ncbi:EH domain-containing protein 3-like [Neodiprion virginianus]|uniref:EH domain-containing protein 3-like n=1 Tax=Neodiprion virginianus TaxID=2961670 RepID=UPI001EE6BD52|nr:EH domain-containing protein 3-like [Neodiprion virginianus]